MGLITINCRSRKAKHEKKTPPVRRLTRDELEVKASTWRTQTSHDSVELSRGRSSFQEDTPVAALMG